MLELSKPTHVRLHRPGKRDQPITRLVLTGFMGAGKSTVGFLLARELGWQFLDLDTVIEEACGKSVAEIFRQDGEAYFRGQERSAIDRLQERHELVLALGGGAIEDPLVLSAVMSAPESCLIFLDAPLEELLERVRSGDGVRPLLAREEEMEARHRRRLPHYRAAHLTVVTSGLSAVEVTAQILAQVGQERGV
jgi:shikimate kinase